MTNHDRITTNFSISEFATAQGEFNMDLRYSLALQAFRSWYGKPLYISSGCRNGKNNSAHNIELWEGGFYITIPATGSDPYDKVSDTWELMKELEDFEEEISDNLNYFAMSYNGFDYFKMSFPLFTGRGCYPDTNNQCIHLDMGHLSMNPKLREKRTNADGSPKVVRWFRYDGVYHYGSSFAELREKYEQIRRGQ